MGYTGDVYVGSDKQKMTVYYDTGSAVKYQC